MVETDKSPSLERGNGDLGASEADADLVYWFDADPVPNESPELFYCCILIVRISTLETAGL